MVSIRSTTANFILRLPRRNLSSTSQSGIASRSSTSILSNQSQPSLSTKKTPLHQSTKPQAALAMGMAGLVLSRPASTLSTTTIDAAVETGEGETVADRIYDPTNYMNNLTTVQSLQEISTAANALLAQFRAEKGPLTSSQYEEYAKSFADKRLFVAAYEVVQGARAAGVVTSKTCTYALIAVRRTLYLRELRLLFGEEIQSKYPNEGPTDNAEEVSHSQHYEHAKQIMDWMKQDGMELEPFFYDSLASFLCHDLHGGIMLNIAMAMEKKGIQPSNFYYNRMLDTLMRCGYSDRAMMLFNRMIFNDVATIDTYVAWMNVMIDLNKLSEAEKTWGELGAKHGNKLNTIAYNVYLKLCLKQGKIDEALKVLEKMTETPESQPSSVTARVFLSHLMDHPENIPRTKFAFEDTFHRVGFPENSVDYAWIIRLWARFDPPRVLTTFNSIKEKNIPVDSHIAHAFLSILIDRAVPSEWKMSLAEECILKGRKFPPHPQGIAILAPSLPPNFLSLIAMMEHSPTMQVSTLTVDLMMRRMLWTQDFEGIIRLYEGIKSRSMNSATILPQFRVHVSVNHRNFYLTALLRLNRFQEAQAELRHLSSRRLSISYRNINLAQELGVQLPRHRNSAPTEESYSSRRPYYERNNVNGQVSNHQNSNAKHEWQRKYINGSNSSNKEQSQSPAGREAENWI